MRAALVIAAKDLRQRLRDRSAIVMGFVAPLAIAGLMSLAFGQAESFHANVAVVDLDKGPIATAFVDLLRGRELKGLLTVTRTPSIDAARTQVKDRKVDVAVVVPAAFSTAATSERGGASLDLLTSTDSELAAEVVRSIATSFVAQVDANRLSIAAALDAGAPPDRLPALTDAATRLRLPEQVVEQPIGARPLKTVSYYGPSMGIFFVLFAISFTARSFFDERRDGTLDRIAAAPVHPIAVLAGKAMSVFVYGVLSLGTIVAVTSLVFGAEWGSPLGVAAIVVAMVLAIVALTAFVITVSHTDRQADGIAGLVTFGLALLGGNFVFLSVAPEILRRLALLTPNGWALRAFTDLGTGVSGADAVVQPVLMILVFTVVVGGIAAALAPRIVRR